MHDHSHIEHLLMDAETIGWAVFLSITWFSFTMSWHCAAMCGPLACAKFTGKNPGVRNTTYMALSYNLGRILSYTTLGAVIGWISQSAQSFVSEHMPRIGVSLSFIFALILAFQGLRLVRGMKPTSGPAWMGRLSESLLPLSTNNPSTVLQPFVFGVVTVFLPCMTLTAALAAAAMVAEPLQSALVLAGFSLGTLPVMLIVPTASSSLVGLAGQGRIVGLKTSHLQKIGGVFLLTVSGLTFLRSFH